jgi:hypothetical protein
MRKLTRSQIEGALSALDERASHSPLTPSQLNAQRKLREGLEQLEGRERERLTTTNARNRDRQAPKG